MLKYKYVKIKNIKYKYVKIKNIKYKYVKIKVTWRIFLYKQCWAS